MGAEPAAQAHHRAPQPQLCDSDKTLGSHNLGASPSLPKNPTLLCVGRTDAALRHGDCRNLLSMQDPLLGFTPTPVSTHPCVTPSKWCQNHGKAPSIPNTSTFILDGGKDGRTWLDAS